MKVHSGSTLLQLHQTDMRNLDQHAHARSLITLHKNIFAFSCTIAIFPISFTSQTVMKRGQLEVENWLQAITVDASRHTSKRANIAEKTNTYNQKNEKDLRLSNERRFSPKMHSDSGKCEIISIPPFQNQSFSCKLQVESGRGWTILFQPLSKNIKGFHNESFFTFSGYSEECGFRVGCPFRIEINKQSKALQKTSSSNRTPSDFYIKKWNKSELELTFDTGILKLPKTVATHKAVFIFKADMP